MKIIADQEGMGKEETEAQDKKKNEKGVKNKEYNPEELLQDLLVICSALFQKISCGKEEIMGAKKDRSTEEKDEMIKSKNLVETDDASCEVIDEFNSRKEGKMEILPIEPKEIMDDEALEFLLEIIEEYFCLIAHEDCPSEAQEEEAMDLNKKDKKVTCLDSSENNEFDNRKTWTSEPRKEKKETVLTGTEEIVDDETQEENNHRALMEDEEESTEWWHNSRRPLNGDTLDCACEACMKKGPLERHTKFWNVEKDEDRFEKALADQDESLKVEVKDTKVLVVQKFRRKVLASENQRVTYLGSKQDRVQKNFEAVDESENNHIQPEDQFRRTIVRSVDIESDSVILVGKIVHDKVSGDLHESYKEAFRNVKWDKNGEVVTSEVGDVRKCMKAIYTEIVKLLFDPGGRESVSNNILRP
ncbi:5784_t:CDS:2 [Gigaspora margarita]|uniref:5784_t:CDS:1 n=1 Tax=Gigaspora margarita TaxID=4874 RepID=A0ABN7UMB5_GIGMA|nr:5784_t:CDS:2 [Gigaspora margarita]